MSDPKLESGLDSHQSELDFDLDFIDSSSDKEHVKMIEGAAEELEQLSFEIYKADKIMNKLKKRKEYLIRKFIPHHMNVVGASSMKTENGYSVSIKKYTYVKIINKDKFVYYVENRGDEGLLETTYKFKDLSKDDRDKIKYMIEQEFDGKLHQESYGMHHSTQKAYFTKLMETEPDEKDRIEGFGQVSEYYDSRITKN